MTKRKQIALLGLAAVGLVLATSSGAFSATSAERGVEVSVSDDDEAYLAFPDKQLECGNPQGAPQKNTIVRNQLDTSLKSVVVEVSVSGGELRVGPEPGQLGQLGSGDKREFEYQLAPGEEATVQVKPPKQDGQNNSIDSADVVHVRTVAIGDGVQISVNERDFEVNCPAGGDK